MSLSKEITFKELFDLRLLFSVALIVIGIFDVYHVSDYVRNYDDQITQSLGYTKLIEGLNSIVDPKILKDPNNYQINLNDLSKEEEVYFNERTKGLPQKDFFNAIFMLCAGFFVMLIGLFKFYLWFERREILILIEEAKKK